MPYLDLIRVEPATTLPHEETNKPLAPTAPAMDAVSPGVKQADDTFVDEFARQIQAAFAPIRFLTPADCFARSVCSRIGPCERRVCGQPCQNPDLVPCAETD